MTREQLRLGESQKRLDALDVGPEDHSDEDSDSEDDVDDYLSPAEAEGLIHKRYPESSPDECVAGRDDCAGARSLPWGVLCCVECWVLADQELLDAYEEATPDVQVSVIDEDVGVVRERTGSDSGAGRTYGGP